MKFRVLLILMWKHFIVRKRRFILTAVELLSPIFFFVILFLFRHELNPVSKHAAQANYENIIRPEAVSFETASKPGNVWFTPDTETTRLLMEKVKTKLEGASGTTFMPNTEEINLLKDDDALIVFENSSASSSMETLNYTLRFNNVFMTHTYESLNEDKRPNSGFGRTYEPFMSLQWAIDMSYLEIVTGEEVKQKLTFQEFPYVEPKGNSGTAILCSTLKSICFLSLLLNFVTLLTRLLQERCSGIKELMKMKGLHAYQLAVSHFLNVLAPALVFAIVGAVLCTVGENPLFKYSNGFLLFLTLLLYSFTIVSMAFACSYIPTSTQYATTLAVLVYIGLWIPASTIMDRDIGRTLALLAGVLPHQPMIWVWKEAEELEKYGQGITFSTIARSHSKISGSVLAAYALMLIQSFIFFAITMYLDLVRPGKFGQALPWNFICQRNYWRKNDIKPDSEMDDLEGQTDSDPLFFENAPHNLGLGIKIMNVSKVFCTKQRALDNVSLDVYQGEITVLLGHNGAGKTTLMSIITGMLSPSAGRVEINGADISSNPHAARKQLGMCPQHNIVFTDLTVLENVMFFTLLKGGAFFDAKVESEKLLDQLGILNKKNNRSMELSGGMKRRLQLACALAGNSDVLILDEPTSGLDVETRRELWDLLLSLRKSRTVLLSTHFMEEADALGDRVAALHAGRLRCFATPLHLKKAIGTGYRLTFTTKAIPKEDLITSAVTSHVDSATVKESSLNSISYNLPATSCDKFPQLFADLENKRWELGIESIGVGVSTLEEVFLKLCSDVNTTFTQQDDTDAADNDTEKPELVYLTGMALYAHQFLVLLKRQINYILTRIQGFLVMEVILPILMIVLTFNIFNSWTEADIQKGTVLPLDLDVYNTLPERYVLYDVNGSDSGLRAISDRYPGVLFQRASHINEIVMQISKERIMDFGKYLIGIELNDTHAKVLYSTTVRHAAPIGLNLLSNLIASRMPSLAPGIIHTYNQPKDGKLTDSSHNEPKSITSAILSVITVNFIILATCIHAAALPCKERMSGARHLHVMAGAPAALYWVATLLTHTTVAIFTLVLPTAITAALIDNDHTFNEPVFIGSLSLSILLGCMAFFALAYLISFYFGENGTSFLLVLIIIVFGLILPGVKTVGDVLKPTESTTFLGSLLTISSYVLPPHSLTVASGEAAIVARLNALCELNRHKCPQLPISEHGFDPEKCCASTGNPYCFFCMDETAPALKMLCLVIQCAVLMLLVVLTELGIFKALYEKIMNARYKLPTRVVNDEMVRAERAYVEKAIALPTKQITDAMLVSDVHKNYKLVGKSCNAVKGISFSVKKGECFGLLGVNGAGKSSTFKVLTGEEWPTRGQVMGHGHHLQGQMREYLKSLGYCPQFFGLDEFQTGYENLALLLTLRGLKASDIDAEVKSWIKVVGLEKYAARRVSGYSGGCMRRLAAAAALCRGAAITLLDEPTAGVDVAARRRVWVALRRGLAQKRAIVITSHSMDEMEALCNRIAIMSEGMICALGSPAALRAAYASGHAVIIKVKHSSPSHQPVDETDSGKSQLHQLKGLLNQKFNCTLKDEHKTMLHYHINETLHYSELFQELEALKRLFPHLVEDYSVTETTLEEVFLSFAKNPQESNAAEATPV